MFPTWNMLRGNSTSKKNARGEKSSWPVVKFLSLVHLLGVVAHSVIRLTRRNFILFRLYLIKGLCGEIIDFSNKQHTNPYWIWLDTSQELYKLALKLDLMIEPTGTTHLPPTPSVPSCLETYINAFDKQLIDYEWCCRRHIRVPAVLQTAPDKPAASGMLRLVINAQEVTSATCVLGDTLGGCIMANSRKTPALRLFLSSWDLNQSLAIV